VARFFLAHRFGLKPFPEGEEIARHTTVADTWENSPQKFAYRACRAQIDSEGTERRALLARLGARVYPTTMPMQTEITVTAT
jgi:hypothetical protein